MAVRCATQSLNPRGSDLRKFADGSLLGYDVSISSDADPVTSAEQKCHRGKCENLDSFHEKLLFDTMRFAGLMDSEKFGTAVGYFEIFNFTVSLSSFIDKNSTR